MKPYRLCTKESCLCRTNITALIFNTTQIKSFHWRGANPPRRLKYHSWLNSCYHPWAIMLQRIKRGFSVRVFLCVPSKQGCICKLATFNWNVPRLRLFIDVFFFCYMWKNQDWLNTFFPVSIVDDLKRLLVKLTSQNLFETAGVTNNMFTH